MPLAGAVCWGVCMQKELGGLREGRWGWQTQLLMTSLCHQKQNTSWLFAKQRTFPYFFLTNEPCSKCFQKHLCKVHRHFQATSEPFLKLFNLCMILNPCSSISPSMVHYAVLWNRLGCWLGCSFWSPFHLDPLGAARSPVLTKQPQVILCKPRSQNHNLAGLQNSTSWKSSPSRLLFTHL